MGGEICVWKVRGVRRGETAIRICCIKINKCCKNKTKQNQNKIYKQKNWHGSDAHQTRVD